MNLRKSPEPPMPEDLAKITSVDELHAMEQMTQHTIAELMKLQDRHQLEINQLAERKRFISKRIVELLAVEFDKVKEAP